MTNPKPAPIAVTQEDMSRECPTCRYTKAACICRLTHPDTAPIAVTQEDESCADAIRRAEVVWRHRPDELRKVLATIVARHRLTRPDTAPEGLVEAAILCGVGKINGDGWKDTTRKGEIVFVWNSELPEPYAKGQYPRVGCEGWSASADQYDFAPATKGSIPSILAALAKPTAPDGVVEAVRAFLMAHDASAMDHDNNAKEAAELESIANLRAELANPAPTEEAERGNEEPREHIMEWDDYDAACDMLARAHERHKAERVGGGVVEALEAARDALEFLADGSHDVSNTAVIIENGVGADGAVIAAGEALDKVNAALANPAPAEGVGDGVGLGLDADGMCDEHGKFGCQKCIASLLAARQSDSGEVEMEVVWEVWQDDMIVASSTNENDARHYLAVYSQDGPAILTKAVTTRAARAALNNQTEGAGE